MREASAGRNEVFDRHRKMLFSIAYRMLGSVADAEDVVQEAFVRWQGVSEDAVRSPKSYLSTVVTRLCIDQLRSARVWREEYVGTWLPEPLPTGPESDAAGEVLLDESLSMAFLVLLENLTPVERAVFLLREVFDCGYDEISRAVGKSEANCRQIAHRARGFIASRRPRFDPSPERREQLMSRFVAACTDGDLPALLEVLADDITVWSDGGGKVPAAQRPIRGAESVARFFLGLMSKAPPGFEVRIAWINGQPTLVGYAGGQPFNVLAFDTSPGGIEVIRIVVNPEKLGAVPALL